MSERYHDSEKQSWPALGVGISFSVFAAMWGLIGALTLVGIGRHT